MTPTLSPKVTAYASLCALALLGTAALRRPELAVLAAPFALVLGIALAVVRRPDVSVSVTLERDRAVEHEEIRVEVAVAAPRAVERLELLLALPRGVELAAGANPTVIRLEADEPRALELTLRCSRWGAHRLGEVFVRAHEPFGVVSYARHSHDEQHLKVFPRWEPLQSLLQPLETQASVGDEVAREKGEGLEFADIRAFAPGDRIRRVNWRVSARRGTLYVNERHPERNTDVVLFLDTFAEARRDEAGTLDLAVRAAASLAAHYLDRRDRVGLVGFGGVLRWLAPGTGPVQRYKIVEALLESEIFFSYAWKGIGVVPPRMLPPKALIVALSPLLDRRTVDALLNLRSRGFDLAVLEVSPVPFVSPGKSPLDELAYRLWQLRRAELRARYERVGVAVAEWREGMALQEVLEGVTAYRRRARLARV